MQGAVGEDGDAGIAPCKWAGAILLACSWENRQVKKKEVATACDMQVAGEVDARVRGLMGSCRARQPAAGGLLC